LVIDLIPSFNLSYFLYRCESQLFHTRPWVSELVVTHA
jgi:hypothetical protein